MACGSAHPEQIGVRCIASDRYPNHDHHFAMHAGQPVEWENVSYVAPAAKPMRKADAADKLKHLADQVPPRATARHTDPVTSHIAAASVGDLRPHQALVLSVLRDADGPLTDEEVFLKVDGSMSVSGARTRRSELVEMGLVEDSGAKGLTVNGRPSIRWRAVQS